MTLRTRLRPPNPAVSSHPAWLRALLEDQAPPPKLFAWTPANLSPRSYECMPPSSSSPSSSPSARPAADLDRRIFILGVGNIGRLYASHLARHIPTPPLTLVVHREELLAQWLSAEGLELIQNGVPTRNKTAFDIEYWTETPPECGPVREVADGAALRNLIIATKASAAVPQADRLRRYLDGESTVAFTQNGITKLWPPHGPAYVTRRYPVGDAPNFLACVTGHGLYSLGPFRSVHASPAGATVGPVLLNRSRHRAPSVDYLTRQLVTAPLLACTAVSATELWLRQLEKLVYNSVINPLTAVLRCKNGALFEDPPANLLSPVIERLLAETGSVLQALVSDESSTPILETADAGSLESLREQLSHRFAPVRLHKLLYDFGATVADNDSSMLQDVRAGKQTEVHDFNGWIVETAERLQQGLVVPTHRALVTLVDSATVLTKEELVAHLLVEYGVDVSYFTSPT
ncbi:hypothetical protein RJ55_01151 [Drechmeria coniospora]|nr:hypothetical protein RJ55_01151 [Drechmeria coniospora]